MEKEYTKKNNQTGNQKEKNTNETEEHQNTINALNKTILDLKA